MIGNKNRIMKLIAIVCVVYITSFMISGYLPSFTKIVNAEVYKYGSKGETVKLIQTKLKRWGYYYGSVDGIYGSKTLSAVKYFQRKNGLVVDGIVGKKTLEALGIYIKAPTTTSSRQYSSNSQDVMLLARLINGEARGEPYEGQVAVGAVVLNRTRSPKFPSTIAGVIYQPGAFTAIVDGQFNAKIRDTSIKAARDALNGWDPSGGALFYYNPAKTTNKWIWSRPVIKVIGSHRFCK
ncbi:spore cortex-lytic enzyme precursor [Clostridium tepidiprofundi DSM 19306]|uniref:Spore cortex-lytic enzyme n=2 Tax=Clostridium TaxID=1485 RepID=A0A151B414_9CLOT|nr:spore cortex-lytic enzyme [Clostridium tepidiprofundi]KYH34648.1 spore cortex-lytic enzyme precursor [Clostridium tepidiprofundi DSM 19306]